MGDEFDGCECVWSHEFAMQRLLAFIRQNQNHCSDTECIDVSGRMQHHAAQMSTGSEDSNYVMITMIMLIAVIMYFVRPESIFKFTTKPSTQGQDPNGGLPPPPSPPAVN